MNPATAAQKWSVCFHLQRGLIRTGKDDYFIEPVRGHNVTAEEKHPHLIYKRSALPKDSRPSSPPVYEGEHSDFCGLEATTEAGVVESFGSVSGLSTQSLYTVACQGAGFIIFGPSSTWKPVDTFSQDTNGLQ
ncbi:Hypp9484 [Branchiostoma lanceolatum]|uniref:Hypp9484 protein n=1 Tax=Branchiostoma lanceolatum TaxID=7740 RepID=A0A8S4MMJ3_BRALA|nr:Hypp9484 [Branchiostoma lanceolatum]